MGLSFSRVSLAAASHVRSDRERYAGWGSCSEIRVQWKLVQDLLRIVEMGPARNLRTSGKGVRNLKTSFPQFFAIVQVVDYILGILAMPKIA